MSTPLIQTKNLSLSVAGQAILDNINFTISPDEIVTIVGPNGAGKSSFLRALIGVQKITAGQIITKKNLNIGYVPQSLNLNRHLPLTVMRFLSLPKRQSKSKSAEALGKAGVPDIANKQMADLSGGQFQRALLARALIESPDILILDEATAGLDQPGIARFYQLIADVRNQSGCAVLMVSHELNIVMGASDRVICLNQHICCQGTPDLVASNPEYRALFGVSIPSELALYTHEHDHNHEHDDTGACLPND